MSRQISIQAQRQAIGRAIDVQRRIASGQAVKAAHGRSQEELQLSHLQQVDKTLAWVEAHRTEILMVTEQLRVAEERAKAGGPVR